LTKAPRDAPPLPISTAYREAGHAVIARVLRQSCGQATIVMNMAKNEAGQASTDDPWNTAEHWNRTCRFRGDEMRSIRRGWTMSRMACGEAELEFFGLRGVGDSEDRRQIRWMLDHILPKADRVREEQRLRRHTRALVHRHRAKIERVAWLLLQRKTVPADDIDAAIGVVSVNRMQTTNPLSR
jgi:hypothetical protein